HHRQLRRSWWRFSPGSEHLCQDRNHVWDRYPDVLTRRCTDHRAVGPTNRLPTPRWGLMVLVSLQTSGKSPPLFFVHGRTGIMPLGPYLVRRFGPDQPFYAVIANGFYPGQTIIESAPDMVQAYVAEIIGVRPSGPLIVGGMCEGGLIAIEVVRELQARDREVGPVILADPPVVPPGFTEQYQK